MSIGRWGILGNSAVVIGALLATIAAPSAFADPDHLRVRPTPESTALELRPDDPKVAPEVVGDPDTPQSSEGSLPVPAPGTPPDQAGRRFPDKPDFEDNGYETSTFDPATATYTVSSNARARPPFRTHADLPSRASDPNGALVPNGSHIPLPTDVDDPVCDGDGHYIRVVYAYSGTNDYASEATNIRNIVRRVNAKLIAESKRSSSPSPLVAAQLRCAAPLRAQSSSIKCRYTRTVLIRKATRLPTSGIAWRDTDRSAPRQLMEG